MDGTPHYSIAICTRNRAKMLPASIDAALAQAQPCPSFEVLIIDNASTDDTAAVAQSYVEQDARVRVASAPVAGLARARNVALQEASGSVLIFVDDDALLCPDYLQTLDLLWTQHTPACAGGPVQIDYLDPPPPGWSTAQEQFRGPLDYGSTPRPLRFSTYPEGCNFVVDKEIALRVGGFDERFGPWPHGPWGAEETELCARLDRAGEAIWYHPDLRVTHRISRATRTRRWLLRMAFRRGQAYYYTARSYYGKASTGMFLSMLFRDTLHAFPWLRLNAWSRVFLAAGALAQALRTRVLGEWENS